MSQRTPNANHEKWPEVTQRLCIIRKVIVLMLKYKDIFFVKMSVSIQQWSFGKRKLLFRLLVVFFSLAQQSQRAGLDLPVQYGGHTC